MILCLSQKITINLLILFDFIPFINQKISTLKNKLFIMGAWE